MNPPENSEQPVSPIVPIEPEPPAVPIAAEPPAIVDAPHPPAVPEEPVVPLGVATPVAGASPNAGPLPLGTAAPTGAAIPMAGTGSVAPGARRAAGLRPIVGVIGLLVLLLIAYKLVHHHGNKYEAIATSVTLAIQNNDMKPVESEFNAERLPELENHTQVARLSDMLAPLGKFVSSKEITPAGADAGVHEFTETFANGTKYERYALDADGKIAHFHIGDPPSSSTSP